MNHYKARQRTDNQRWDYTQLNPRTGTVPVGYCAGWHPWSAEDRDRYGMSEEHYAKMLLHRSKYHVDGHATRDEAIQCYRSYLLDNHLDLQACFDTPMKCRACGGWTAYAAKVGGSGIVALCDHHRSREYVEKYFVLVSQWDG